MKAITPLSFVENASSNKALVGAKMRDDGWSEIPSDGVLVEIRPHTKSNHTGPFTVPLVMALLNKRAQFSVPDVF